MCVRTEVCISAWSWGVGAPGPGGRGVCAGFMSLRGSETCLKGVSKTPKDGTKLKQVYNKKLETNEMLLQY